MIFLILLSPFISKILKLPSNVPLIIISLSLIFSFLVSINRGILQGIQKFKGFSVNNTIDPIAKLILGIILVWLGLSVNGAIIALVFAVFLAYILSFPFLKELFMQKQKKIKTKGLKIYTGSTLVSLLFLTLLVNQDILLVKHFFNAEEAGFYAGLATMGKIILFLSAPIIGVMFPVIANLYEKKEKHYHILISSFFLVLILSLIVLLVYFIAPNPSIKIFLGSSYLPIAPYLILFGFAILLYSLSNLLVSYFLSIDKKHFLWPLGASVILEFVLIWFYHQNFLNITKILILVMGLTFASFCFLYLYEKRRRILIKIKKEK